MVLFPNAKINVGLRIVARRRDGYHDIETVFYPVKLHDALEFVNSDSGEDELSVTGIDTGADASDNLVTKAISRLRQKYQFPFLKLHLHKAIPAGAGLGGGSSDASCILKSVDRYFSLGISSAELNEMALGLGSDCPFFLENQPAYATGRGENLDPVSRILDGYYLVLMNPGVHVSTKEAYSVCIPAKPAESLKELISRPVSEWKDLIINDFEDFAFRKYPVIRELKRSLYDSGALFSLMSGSGSSVFGIFKEKPVISGEYRNMVIFEGKA